MTCCQLVKTVQFSQLLLSDTLHFREQLTINMPSLECRHSSSEEDLLSTDDLDSVTDPEGVPYEEYAITFDLPGNSSYFYPVVIFTTGMVNSKFMSSICLTSLTRAKCGVRSTLCWKVGNISGST